MDQHQAARRTATTTTTTTTTNKARHVRRNVLPATRRCYRNKGTKQTYTTTTTNNNNIMEGTTPTSPLVSKYLSKIEIGPVVEDVDVEQLLQKYKQVIDRISVSDDDSDSSDSDSDDSDSDSDSDDSDTLYEQIEEHQPPRRRTQAGHVSTTIRVSQHSAPLGGLDKVQHQHQHRRSIPLGVTKSVEC